MIGLVAEAMYANAEKDLWLVCFVEMASNEMILVTMYSLECPLGGGRLAGRSKLARSVGVVVLSKWKTPRVGYKVETCIQL